MTRPYEGVTEHGGGTGGRGTGEISQIATNRLRKAMLTQYQREPMNQPNFRWPPFLEHGGDTGVTPPMEAQKFISEIEGLRSVIILL